MIAYHGQQSVKDFYVGRMKAHVEADEIIQGNYVILDGGGKFTGGCAVGCTLHSDQHEDFETELGIPEALARLYDSTHEGLSLEQARVFDVAFLETIPVGADLSRVVTSLLIWLLMDETHGAIHYASSEAGKAAVRAIAVMHERILEGHAPTEAERDELITLMAAIDTSADEETMWMIVDAALKSTDSDGWYRARSARDVAREIAWEIAWEIVPDPNQYDARTEAVKSAWEIIAAKLLTLLSEAPVPVVTPK